MHAVVRTYSGPGATELIDLLEARKDEVEQLIRSVNGFVSYALIRSDAGGATVTVCQDKAGADESVRVARDWVLENAADIGAAPPAISEGPVILHLT
jgi:hypothetical protein